MLDQIMKLVKDNAEDVITNNPAIPNEKKEVAISETANGILGSLKEQLGGNNKEDVMTLLKGAAGADNPVVGNVQKAVDTRLVSKVGVDKAAAESISSKIVPAVIDKFVYKTNDPDDKSLTFDGIMSKLREGASDLVNKAKEKVKEILH